MPDNYKFSLNMSPRMEQHQRLSAVQIQAMKILQLQRLELINAVKQELEENPTLEVQDEQTTNLEESPAQETREELPEEKSNIVESLDDSRDEMPHQRPYRSYDTVSKKEEAIQNTPARAITLQDYVYGQFIMVNITDAERAIGEQIIYNINDEGYLKVPVEEIAQTANITAEAVVSVLRIIQKLDPPGVGATSLEECLLLQLDEDDANLELKKTLITGHLKDIEENRLPLLAKTLDIQMEKLQTVVAQIERLNPHPGADFTPGTAPYIVPDIIIKDVDGTYEIILEKEYFANLRINRYYQQMVQQGRGDKKTCDFIRGKIESARRLINAIELRHRTLRRIAQEIVNAQSDFFSQGISRLNPLKMKDVAKHLKLHISTISRAIANKYIQTPGGLFNMKFFFSAAAENTSGEEIAQQKVLSVLKEIVEQEDKKTPLKDIQIAELMKQRQFPISRRTVAKYRMMLKILPVAKRKVY